MVTEIKCYEGVFSLQIEANSKPYQVPPKHEGYALQKLFKEELEWLQQQGVITPLCMDEATQWCRSFILVPKPNGKVQALDIIT